MTIFFHNKRDYLTAGLTSCPNSGPVGLSGLSPTLMEVSRQVGRLFRRLAAAHFLWQIIRDSRCMLRDFTQTDIPRAKAVSPTDSLFIMHMQRQRRDAQKSDRKRLIESVDWQVLLLAETRVFFFKR